MKLFRYDKLNRIKQMQTAEQFQSMSGWEPVSDNYSTEYEYDWNGNLLSLRRNDKYGQIMHDIAYHYPNAANNRLGSITATGLNSGSYRYDAIGNLVRDNAEGLTVSWNALGKVDSICRNGHLLSRFRYSPTGQRQVKMADGDTVFYIHDATGNVMCVYQLKNDTLSATERYMYGGKRLGMFGQQVWIVAGGTAGMSDSSTIGARTYELTDHLGNVTATILDRKRPVLNSYGNMVYIPLIVSYTDYYPFGYPISDRSYYNGGYRYFFNGQEADNEVLGEGALHAFEYRMHDTRLGRFWSVDPLAGKFPWNSVYAFAENRVVDGKELEGLEFISVNNSGVNPEAYENSDGTYNFKYPKCNHKVSYVETWEMNRDYRLNKEKQRKQLRKQQREQLKERRREIRREQYM
jgi:RHS repeat-associated protein